MRAMEKEPIRTSERVSTPEPERTYRYDAIFVFGSYPYPQKPGMWKEGMEAWVEKMFGRNSATTPWNKFIKAKIKGHRAENEMRRNAEIEVAEETDDQIAGKYSRLNHEAGNIIHKIAGKPRPFHPSGLMYDTRLKNLAAYFLALNGETGKIVTMLKPIRTWMEHPYTELERAHIRRFRHETDSPNRVNPKPQFEVVSEEELNGQLSYDLLTKTQQLERISQEKGYKRVAIVIDSVHAKRTRKIIKKLRKKREFSVDCEIRDWESILPNPNYTGPYAKLFEDIRSNYYKSNYWIFWRTREFGVRNAPIGFINWLSELTRRFEKEKAA